MDSRPSSFGILKLVWDITLFGFLVPVLYYKLTSYLSHF